MSAGPSGLEPPASIAAEALAARRDEHNYDRLLMLSDGVFAIAITLAALEIRVPHQTYPSLDQLLSAMAPGLLTYAISFVVIAAYWSGHRRMFGMLVRVDGPLIGLNLLLLGLVALQPAAVALLISQGPRGGAVEVYLGLIMAIGVSQALFWGYAAFVAKLLDPLIGVRFRVGQLVLGLMLPFIAALTSIYSSSSGSPLFVALSIGFVALMILARRTLNRNPQR